MKNDLNDEENLEKEKATASLLVGAVDEKQRLSPSVVASEGDFARAQVAVMKEGSLSLSSVAKDGSDENDQNLLDELIALPTILERQSVRSLRPSRPGAVAVTGIGGGATDASENALPTDATNNNHATNSTDISEIGETNEDSAATAGDDSLSVEGTSVSEQNPSLPVATAVQAELVQDEDYDDVRQQLSEKEKQLQDLNDKLKEMETLKQEVEKLRKKVSTAVPAKKVSISEASSTTTTTTPPSLKRTQSYNPSLTPRMSEREMHAMKVLLGDPPSSGREFDHSSSLPLPDMKRHTSDSQVISTSTYSKSSLQATTKPSSSSSSSRREALTGSRPPSKPSGLTTSSSNSTTTNPVAQSACCVIL